MLERAQYAKDIALSGSRELLETNQMMKLALAKCLQDIGEAAYNVTAATRTRHQPIPWYDIIGMRHRLVHVYYAIDLNVVWKTATVHVPPLIVYLESILSPDGQ